MKRYLYLFPLMAFTAATLTLAGCDDPADEQAADQTAVTAPATTETSALPDAAAPVETSPAAATVINAEGATAYATAEGATTGAVFLTLHNPGAESDKLVGATTSVASTVEIHENVVGADGTMQMRKVDGVEVPPGQQVSLKPDGYHIMLMGLNAPLVQGESFTVTLDFDKAEDVTLPVTITAPGGATASDASASMDHGDHVPAEASDVPTPATDAPATDEPLDLAPAPTSDTTGTPGYGSTTAGEAAESSPSATTDVPSADAQPAQ